MSELHKRTGKNGRNKSSKHPQTSKGAPLPARHEVAGAESAQKWAAAPVVFLFSHRNVNTTFLR